MLANTPMAKPTYHCLKMLLEGEEKPSRPIASLSLFNSDLSNEYLEGFLASWRAPGCILARLDIGL